MAITPHQPGPQHGPGSHRAVGRPGPHKPGNGCTGTCWSAPCKHDDRSLRSSPSSALGLCPPQGTVLTTHGLLLAFALLSGVRKSWGEVGFELSLGPDRVARRGHRGQAAGGRHVLFKTGELFLILYFNLMSQILFQHPINDKILGEIISSYYFFHSVFEVQGVFYTYSQVKWEIFIQDSCCV